jgi:hypothetical protein
MNEIWELDRILDEEDRDIVAHDIWWSAALA